MKHIKTIAIILFFALTVPNMGVGAIKDALVADPQCHSPQLETLLLKGANSKLDYIKDVRDALVPYGEKASFDCFEKYYVLFETEQLISLQKLLVSYRLHESNEPDSNCIWEERATSVQIDQFESIKRDMADIGIILRNHNGEGGLTCDIHIEKGWHLDTFGHLFNDAWKDYYKITDPLVGRTLVEDASKSLGYTELTRYILELEQFFLSYPHFPLIYRQTKNSQYISTDANPIQTFDLQDRFNMFFDFFLYSYPNSMVFRPFKGSYDNGYVLPKQVVKGPYQYTNSQETMSELFNQIQNKALKKTLLGFYNYLKEREYRLPGGVWVDQHIDAYFSDHLPFILNYNIPSRIRGIQSMKRDAVISLVSKTPQDFQSVNKIFRDDKEIVLIVLKKDGTALRYVSQQLKDDPAVILAAMQGKYYGPYYKKQLLYLASKRLQNDPHLLREVEKKLDG